MAASVVAEHGLWSVVSVAVAPRFSCLAACGIFLEQRSNPCPLRWQVGSEHLDHQGSPSTVLLSYFRKLPSTWHRDGL